MVKCVTDYEYTLRRRQLVDGDFIKYIEYMIKLEKLRDERHRARSKAANDETSPDDEGPRPKLKADIAEYRSIQVLMMRHIAYIYERYTRRFPNNMVAWFQYIDYLQRHSARSLLSTIYGRVLSLHPKHEIAWIESARHELKYNNNSHSTRTLLQRALRFNKSSEKLWLYYFEFETWNATRITDRKRVLDLDVDNTAILGAPVVVVRHALEAIPEFSFALKFLKSAKEVSKVLWNKIEEIVSIRFPNSTKLFSYLCLTDLEMERACQRNSTDVVEIFDRESISLDEHRYIIHRPYGMKKLSSVDVLEECKERLARALSRIEAKVDSLHGSIDVENASTGLLLRDEIGDHLQTVYQNIDVFIIRLAHDLSWIGSNPKNIHLPTRRQLTSTTDGGHASPSDRNTHPQDFINIWKIIERMIERLAIDWQKCIAMTPAPCMLATSIISMNRLSSILQSMNSECLLNDLRIPISEGLAFSLDNCANVELLKTWIVISNEHLKSTSSCNLTQVLFKNFETYSETIVELFHYVRRFYSENDLIELCKAYLQGYEIFLRYQKALDFLMFFIDEVISLVNVEMSIDYVNNILRSDYCADSDLILWYTKYLQLHLLVDNDRLDGRSSSIRDSYIRGYRSLLSIFDKKPSTLTKLQGRLNVVFTIVIEQEVSFRDAGIISREVSYCFLKDVLETAIKFCSSDREAVRSFYDKYEKLERELGNHKQANHLAWRRNQTA